MKIIRSLTMLAGSLLLVGLALNQSAKAYDKASDCDGDAQQFYNDCMANNNVGPDVCSYMADQAWDICMDN